MHTLKVSASRVAGGAAGHVDLKILEDRALGFGGLPWSGPDPRTSTPAPTHLGPKTVGEVRFGPEVRGPMP